MTKRPTPWRDTGLDDEQAARCLLDRWAFGSTPAELERVRRLGIHGWLDEQLDGPGPGPVLEERLESLPAWSLDAETIAAGYPDPGRLLRDARDAGVLDGDDDPQSYPSTRRRVRRWAREQGYGDRRELARQLRSQRLWHALEGRAQVVEVLHRFWVDRLWVSGAHPRAGTWLLSYERDALRPRALDPFDELLTASAKHPAMLLYLDNAVSSADEGRRRMMPEPRRLSRRRRRPRGVNENYARELLELHTLGVEGGYDQRDVEEAARVFTGWTVRPPEARVDPRRLRRAGGDLGDDGFLFLPFLHDAEPKRVLGRRVPGQGIQEGEWVLRTLAAHPSTARHVAAAFVRRFVADEPPAVLVDRVAEAHDAGGGRASDLVRALVSAPEAWAPGLVRAKVRSPFELAVAALRGLGAEVVEPTGIFRAVERMGQLLYAETAPTGEPDTAEEWLNSGTVAERLRFGLDLAGGRIPGVRVDLAHVVGPGEPAGAADAVRRAATSLLPAHEVEATVQRVLPLVTVDDLEDRLAGAGTTGGDVVARAVGLVLSSPAFQRR